MNLFYLDEDIELCAQAHFDIHVNKMISEGFQVLCTAVQMHGGDAPWKMTHKNHPVVRWAAASDSNWNHQYILVVELCLEYEFRFDKQHAVSELIEQLDDVWIPYGALTAPPNCTPYKELPVLEAYRKYYQTEKRRLSGWTLRGRPDWFK